MNELQELDLVEVAAGKDAIRDLNARAGRALDAHAAAMRALADAGRQGSELFRRGQGLFPASRRAR